MASGVRRGQERFWLESGPMAFPALWVGIAMDSIIASKLPPILPWVPGGRIKCAPLEPLGRNLMQGSRNTPGSLVELEQGLIQLPKRSIL